MRITELFTAKSIALDVAAPDQAAIIDRLVELQATHGNITDKEAYKKALYAREAEGGGVITALQVTCHKACHHAVTRAHAVDHFAFRAADAVGLTCFIQQQSAIPCHAHQNVAGAFFLQGPGCCHDFILRVQNTAHDLAQLMIVGLNEEGVVLQHIHQQVAGGIHHRAHALALQPRQ